METNQTMPEGYLPSHAIPEYIYHMVNANFIDANSDDIKNIYQAYISQLKNLSTTNESIKWLIEKKFITIEGPQDAWETLLKDKPKDKPPPPEKEPTGTAKKRRQRRKKCSKKPAGS